MKVSLEAVKALREKTGVSLGEVRRALEEAGGNEAKALEALRRRGVQLAQQRGGRATGQGRIEAYVHHDGRLGALVEVDCETDFVARTPDFIQFCKELALHVAAAAPRYVSREAAPAGEPDPADGPVCLLDQPFVKDEQTTVGDLLKALIAKTGENVVIKRFARFVVGAS